VTAHIGGGHGHDVNTAMKVLDSCSKPDTAALADDRRLACHGRRGCAFVLTFQAQVAKPYRIPSPSMEPTLHCAKLTAFCPASRPPWASVSRPRAPRQGETQHG
jgi:hypothetical protein